MTQSTSIEDAKAELRRQARARRDALPAGMRAAAAQAIAERPFPVAITPQAIVSGFMPIGSEINPIALMRKLAGCGARLALPAVAGPGKPLTMRAFVFGQRLVAGTWGIREPASDAAEVFPDILLVPLLAFDRSGERIGYGADDCAPARAQDRHRVRPRLRCAGNPKRAHDGARRAPRSCANRARRH
jgi:5-formyltetrahydrofolate cyclo-ligase